jgi:small subunit ribosomal protein S21
LAYVELQQGESFDSALRRFKRKVQQEAIIKEIKKHTVFLKPGERKRLKAAQALKRMRKRMRKDFSEI